MERQFHVYILTNSRHTVLYTGVTSDLIRRIYEHRTKATRGFSSRYNVDKLVWFEEASSAANAINREKQIKAGSRQRKCVLITRQNPDWRDLYPEIVGN